MTASQIRNKGYAAIVKNNQSHQEVFDELTQTKGVDRDLLAEELSKIPSSGKQKSTASLRYIFVTCLAFIALLRLLAIVMVQIEGRVDLLFLVFLSTIIIIVPVLGTYAALFHKNHLYTGTGLLLIVSLLRTIQHGELPMKLESLIVIIPFATSIFLAFHIQSKLKTAYKKTMTESYTDGKLVKKIDYVFEDTRVNESNLLDSEF
ncbi:MAG: hypothetical protein AB8B56_19405 [Crocinitomicaceae bacterium]